jgi:acyl-CoA reductase-like NAD-dependent aldehyde dehydrogenase
MVLGQLSEPIGTAGIAPHRNFLPPRLDDPRLLLDRRYRMVIDGQAVDAASGETIRRDSPAHPGVTVGTWPRAGREDADRALQAARKTFDQGPWPRMSGGERSRILHRVAALILQHQEELATIETLEVGKAIGQARGEMAYSADLWSFAAGAARGLEGETQNGLGGQGLGLILRDPVGVVGIVTPWNFPLLIGSERIPWALGAGCTVVVKPSEFTSGSTIRLAELALEAGLPPGVLNVVTGYGDPAGQMLAEDPRTDMLSFTGSARVGKLVGRLAADTVKRVGLELGGKGPQVVFADADLDQATHKIASSIFGCAGQACISGSRLIVERPVHDELVARITALAGRITIGDPLDDRTKVGSLIHDAHLAKVESYVAQGIEAGARLVLGGDRLGQGGCFYAPTVFTGVTPDMAIARDEIFGPVLSVLPFDTAEQALELANDTPYGLSASVWTRDLNRALATIRAIRAGRTWINTTGDGAPEIAIGGQKQSGLGRELGRHGFDEYCAFKNVYVATAPLKPWIE